MKGLLLAGGFGTRLRPLTFTGNKHMIPIANQPILFYGLKQFARVGIRDVGIVLGPIQEGIRDAVGDGSEFGLRVNYIEQGPPRGLAHAVLCARPFLGKDPFVMYLGDNLLEKGLESFVDLFNREQPDAVLGVTPVSDAGRYGVAEVSGNRIVSIEEKPRVPKSNLALVGIYVFSPKVHDIIDRLAPSSRGELEITDALRRMHAEHLTVRVQRVYGWWKDTGAPEDLLEANDLVLNSKPQEEFLREGTIASGAFVAGSVAIGKDTIIEDGARVEGPAVLGSGVRLTRGSSVGPGTSIGDHVELRGCSVRRSILLERAKVVGPLHIRDSLIGRGAEIQGLGVMDHEVTVMLGDSSRIRF